MDYFGNDGNEKEAPASAAARPADLTEANMMDDVLGSEEFPPELSSMSTSSAPSRAPPYASLSAASTFKNNDDRDPVHCSGSSAKRMEHAPPSEPMHSPGFRMVGLLERPPVDDSATEFTSE